MKTLPKWAMNNHKHMRLQEMQIMTSNCFNMKGSSVIQQYCTSLIQKIKRALILLATTKILRFNSVLLRYLSWIPDLPNSGHYYLLSIRADWQRWAFHFNQDVTTQEEHYHNWGSADSNADTHFTKKSLQVSSSSHKQAGNYKHLNIYKKLQTSGKAQWW